MAEQLAGRRKYVVYSNGVQVAQKSQMLHKDHVLPVCGIQYKCEASLIEYQKLFTTYLFKALFCLRLILQKT